jgi:hypothetical protein
LTKQPFIINRSRTYLSELRSTATERVNGWRVEKDEVNKIRREKEMWSLYFQAWVDYLSAFAKFISGPLPLSRS